MRFAVDRLDHLVLNVRDVDESAAWYERVLGMEVEIYGRDNRTALKFGGQKINLRPSDTTEHSWVAARVPMPGAADFCFISAVPIPEVIGHLQHCGILIEKGPVDRIGALGPMQSVYVRDPDGNLVEIASYMRA